MAGDVNNFVANGCLGTPPNTPNYQNPQRSEFETYYAALTNNGNGYNANVVPSSYGLPGGVGVSFTYTPPAVAYGGVTVTPSKPPTPPPVNAPPVSNANTGGSTGGSNATPAAQSNPFGFLTQTSVGGLQNWMLIAGGFGALMLLPMFIGKR